MDLPAQNPGQLFHSPAYSARRAVWHRTVNAERE